jgi:class 3 adenylate cyclase
MSASISFKQSVIILFCGIACAVGMAFLLNFLLKGPKLGPVYDFLLNSRQPPPVSREILIINTGDYIESSDVFSALITLTEMEAANLVLTAGISGLSSRIIVTEGEIRSRFLDEFTLFGNNIRNMFEAIRSGSIPPAQAPVYVERLVELTEQGRDRLLSALIDRDEDLFRSITLFGNFTEVELKPVFDRDGKLRRISPVETESSLEHPVYNILKRRFAVSQIVDSVESQILKLRRFDGEEIEIPLDSNGNILSFGQGFRSIDIELFNEYEEAGRSMSRALKKADELGAFSQTIPEYSPLFIDNYVYDLREELIKYPDREKRIAWTTAREDYFNKLEDFLYGPAEMGIVSGYEEVIAGENTLKKEGLLKLGDMRDELIRSFNTMREEYSELSRLHSLLKKELASSFCIMGPFDNTSYSAVLANVLITGNHIKPVYQRHILFWSITAAFIVLLIIFKMRPLLMLLAGLGSSAAAACAFGLFFIFTSHWIDPIIVFGSSFTGTLVTFYCKCTVLRYRARRFRTAYGAAVSADILQELIRRGRPRVSEISVAKAVVVAVKNENLFKTENREKPREAGKAQKAFFAEAKKILFDAGAVIAGYEGDTILACFGSPFNKSGDTARNAKKIKSGSPGSKGLNEYTNDACSLVKELLEDEKKSWRFGIDSGECTFCWSPETGFSVNGRPAVRARVLAAKTARFNVYSLITSAVRDKTNYIVKKIGSFNNGNDFFFELI